MLSDNGCFGYVLYKYSVFGLCKWVEIGLNFFCFEGFCLLFFYPFLHLSFLLIKKNAEVFYCEKYFNNFVFGDYAVIALSLPKTKK